ncbi:MAG TPA: phytanoyl-CoA dioxygenase family protein [Myxococcota bacterium]|nr:phytanoyl-CoA dioxygenase family protein [Myxococcota bacterium]
MIKRVGGNLTVRRGDAPEASAQLEREGWAVLRGALDPGCIAVLTDEIAKAFELYPAERGRGDKSEFRYEMLNRAPGCQAAVGTRAILDVIEPLLGEDCHVIANTAWWNPASFGGGPWHCDAGPHVPRPEGVAWDDRIPYPVFAIGAHLYLRDCPLECGPTAVIPGSHRSGRLPPFERMNDESLDYEGRRAVALEARAGDVGLFVSDAWHRGLRAKPGGTGRLFLQVHYARRDLAQRIRTTADANQLSQEAISRIASPRERTLLGLHSPYFYDG